MGVVTVIMLLSSVYTAINYPNATSSERIVLPKTETALLFEPDIVSVKPGETFTIMVTIRNLDEELWGFEVGVKFDKTMLEYVGVEYPSWQFVSGKTGWLFWVASISPQQGNQTLLELTFKMKKTGITELTFYSHKLSTVRYIDRLNSYIGWPIEHVISIAVITSNY